MAKTHQLSDNFNDNSLNGTLWGTYTDFGGTVTESSQRINLSPGASVVSSNALIQAQTSYDLTGSGLAMKLAMTTVVGTATLVYLDAGSNNDWRVYMSTGDNLLKFQKRVSGSDTTIWSVTYNPTDHAYLFFAEQRGVVYAFVSATGLPNSWSNPAGAGVGGAVSGFAITALTPKINCFVYQSTASPGSTTIDWINATGTAPSQATGVAVAATRWDRSTLSLTAAADALWFTVDRSVAAAAEWVQVGDEVMAPLLSWIISNHASLLGNFVPSPGTHGVRVTARSGEGAAAVSAAATCVMPDYSPPAATRYAAGNGAYGNDGLTPATPWNIQKAIEQSAADVVIQVNNGTISATDTTTFYTAYGNGEMNRHCVWRAETKHGVTWTLTGTPADTTAIIVMEAGASYFDFWGFIFDGALKVSNGVLCKSNHHVRFIGCRFKDCGASGIATSNDGTSARCDYIAAYDCDGGHIGNYPGTLYGWGSVITLHDHSAYDTHPGIHSWVVRCRASGCYDGNTHSPPVSDGNGFLLGDYPATSDGGENAPHAVAAASIAFKNGGRGFHTKNGANAIYVNNTSYKNGLDTAVVGGPSGNNGEIILHGDSPDVAGVNRNNYVYNMLVENWQTNGRLASDEINNSTLHTGNRWRRVQWKSDDLTPEVRLSSTITSDSAMYRQSTGNDHGWLWTPPVHPTNTGQYATAEAPWDLPANAFRPSAASDARNRGIDPVADLSGVIDRKARADLQLVAYLTYDGQQRLPGAWDLGALQYDDEPNAYDEVVAGRSPHAYYRLGETSGTQAVDSSGNARHGTYVNTPTLAEPGLIQADPNRAALFNSAQSEHVTLPSGFANWTATGLTIEAWVLPTAATSWARIVELANGAPSNNIFLARNGVTDGLWLGVYDGTTGTGFGAAGALPLNQVSHIVAVIPAGTAGSSVTGQLWRNGVLVATGAVDVPNNVSRSVNYLGRSAFAADGYWQGWLDEVAIYAGVLTEAQILTNYAWGRHPGRPFVQCAISLVNPGLTPVWTDVTPYLLSASWGRGRAMEVDRFEAGAATVVLNNTDRRFEPEYSGSPYYPNLLPRRRVRLRATWADTIYDQYHGRTSSYRPSYPGINDGIVTLSAHDGLTALARAAVTASRGVELSGARVAAVLDAIGWPAGDRSLDGGVVPMMAEAIAGETALSHCQAIEEAEQGFVYADRQGRICFRERTARITAPYTTYLTLGEQEAAYADLDWTYDDQLIVNEARITREGGVEQVLVDATSAAQYGPIVYARGGLRCAEDGDALAVAYTRVTRYAQPRMRGDRLTLDPMLSPATYWPHVLGRDISDRLLLRKRPPGGGAAIERAVHLEAVNIQFVADGADWAVEWTVSPAETQTYWIVGDPTYGVVGSTTRVY